MFLFQQLINSLILIVNKHFQLTNYTHVCCFNFRGISYFLCSCQHVIQNIFSIPISSKNLVEIITKTQFAFGAATTHKHCEQKKN